MKTLRFTSAMLAVLLLASGVSPVLAADEVKPSFFARAKDKVSSAAKTAGERAKSAYASAKSGSKSAATKVYANVFKPYATADKEVNANLASFTAKVNGYKVNAAKENAGKTAKAKSAIFDALLKAREFPYEHPYVGNAVWYAGLATVAAAGTYGAYKLYQKYNDSKFKYVSGKFDAIKDFAENCQNQTDVTGFALAEGFKSEIERNKEILKSLKELSIIDTKAFAQLLNALDEYMFALSGTKKGYSVKAAYKKLVRCVSKANEKFAVVLAAQA